MQTAEVASSHAGELVLIEEFILIDPNHSISMEVVAPSSLHTVYNLHLTL